MQIRFSAILTVLIAVFVICSVQPANAVKEHKPYIASVVVEVNGEPIYEEELIYFLIRRYGQDVVSELIKKAMLAGKASEYKITVDKDLPREEMLKNYGQDKFQELSKVFDIEKILEASRREHLAAGVYDAMVEKIKKENKIEISDHDALDYYLKNVDDWSRPAMVRFSIIVTENKADADKAIAELDGGTAFGDVAKKYSKDPNTKDSGGDIGELVPQNFPFSGKMEDALFSLSIDKHSEIIGVGKNFFIVMPTERVPALEKKYPEVKDYIVSIMTAEKVEPFLKTQLDKLREESKTEIYYPFFDVDSQTEKGFVKVDKLPAPTGVYKIYPIVVKVNGTPISEQEMIFYLLRQYGQKVLQELTVNMIFYQQAKAMGVEVDKGEAGKILESTFGPEETPLLEKAFDMDAVRNAIYRELMSRKALDAKRDLLVKEKGINISDSEARKVYDSNKNRYVIPERVRFSIIVTEKEGEAQSAINEINSGIPFGDIAKKYSIDDKTKDAGGDMQMMLPRGMFQGPYVELEKKIFELNVDQVSDPIYLQNRFYIIKITEKAAKEEKSFDDVKKSIIDNMIDERIYEDMSKWSNELRNSVDLKKVYPFLETQEKIQIDPSNLKVEEESKSLKQ